MGAGLDGVEGDENELDGADFEGLAERFQRERDAIDLRGVTHIDEACDLLRFNAQPARQLRRTHSLSDHFIQQKDFRGETGW